jgi:hypothetical protein
MKLRIIEIIFSIITFSGGAGAIGYGLFVFLGKKSIEHKFNESFEKYKSKLNALFSRISKIQEKEFEVLPEAWTLLVKAIGAIDQLVGLRLIANLDGLNDAQIEEIINTLKTPESEKDRLRKATNKTKVYDEIITRNNIGEARSAQAAFHNYIILNKIFLTEELHSNFDKIDKLLINAFVNVKMSEELKSQEQAIEAYRIVSDKIKPEINNIEKIIQNRLHYHEVN